MKRLLFMILLLVGFQNAYGNLFVIDLGGYIDPAVPTNDQAIYKQHVLDAAKGQPGYTLGSGSDAYYSTGLWTSSGKMYPGGYNSTNPAAGWVSYAYEAPEGMLIDSFAFSTWLYVAQSNSGLASYYYTTDPYDGTSAPIPGNWTLMGTNNATGYKTFNIDFDTPVERVYMSYYLDRQVTVTNFWNFQQQQDATRFYLTTVPEPTTLGLLAVVGCVTVLRRRK